MLTDRQARIVINKQNATKSVLLCVKAVENRVIKKVFASRFVVSTRRCRFARAIFAYHSKRKFGLRDEMRFGERNVYMRLKFKGKRDAIRDSFEFYFR